jgi:acyl carrier protein
MGLVCWISQISKGYIFSYEVFSMTVLELTTDVNDHRIDEICALDWRGLTEDDLLCAAWGYYYFSVQFRENLELACELYPEDENLQALAAEECDTANLSPYPEIARAGERLDHDEFMRRALSLSQIDNARKYEFENAGNRYLSRVRAMAPKARALSIASYETGGLERVFRAILHAPVFENPALRAFRFFLKQHIQFDSAPDHGHGQLSRHLIPDESVAPLWAAFRQLFVDFTPHFGGELVNHPPSYPGDQQAVTIRTVIFDQVSEIAAQQRKKLAPLSDDLPLMESGLDSLCIAVLVATLDDLLGIDPFTEDSADFPITLGDFIRLYENAST